jgi:hypothetical protein
LASSSAPLIWSLLQRKCADGAVVTFDQQGAHLHIVELKGKLTAKTWARVLEQYEGMFLTSVAVARLLEIRDFASVTCYIAGSEDSISGTSTATAAPALIKTPVGKAQSFGGLEAWTSSSILLPMDTRSALKKAWRDKSGDVHFGKI